MAGIVALTSGASSRASCFGSRRDGSPPGEETLIRRVREGDALAQEIFYKRHVQFVFGTVVRLLGSRDEAEDIVQETFALGLRDLHLLRNASAVRGWLVQIAVRQVHRVFRRKRLLRMLGFSAAEDPAAIESVVSPDAGPEVRAEIVKLWRVLPRMDSDQRVAWSLRFVEDYSLEEVAELCQCSLATAKRRIAAAAAVMRQHMSRGGGCDA